MSYRLIHHASGGDAVYQGGPMPLSTIEGQTVVATVPGNPVGVGTGPQTSRNLRVGPNPARLGTRVEFIAGQGAGREVEIFDLEGRRVARLPFVSGSGARRAAWTLRDQRGQSVRPGVYLARAAEGERVRVVVLSP